MFNFFICWITAAGVTLSSDAALAKLLNLAAASKTRIPLIEDY
jgi:hypothetical protein